MKYAITLILSVLLLVGCKQEHTLRVLQLNIWQEGTIVENGYDAIIQQIIDSKADIITLSEVRNYNNSRFCDRIVKSLAEKGHTFYSFYSNDSGILSRFPITDSTQIFPLNNDRGSIYRALVSCYGHPVAIYTAHLDYKDCAYYMVKGYDGSTWEKYDAPVTNIDTILKVNVASKRDDAIINFIQAAAKDKEQGCIIFLGGDFNEPSHQDWVEESKNMYERQGLVIPWTVTTLLTEAGYVDTYREKHPNPVTHPGITYPADCPGAPIEKLTWAPESDEQERIDYLFYSPSEGLKLSDVIIWGPEGTIKHSQRVVEKTQDRYAMGNAIWPTDHKGVLATFTLK